MLGAPFSPGPRCTMAGRGDDVQIGAGKFVEKPLGTIAPADRYYTHDPPKAPLLGTSELKTWSFWRAGIAELFATFLFLYITIGTFIGNARSTPCTGVGMQGVAWAFGATIFILVYCIAGISGGHINPAVTFGLLLGRKISVIRALYYIICQVLGAIAGAGLVKGFQKTPYEVNNGGTNFVARGYTKGSGLGAEIVGTFVLVYVVFSATDAKRNASNTHVPVLAPLPIGFAVFLVHMATLPITSTGINPARSFGAAVIFNRHSAWADQWIFWVGPLLGAALAAAYHVIVIRGFPFKKRT